MNKCKMSSRFTCLLVWTIYVVPIDAEQEGSSEYDPEHPTPNVPIDHCYCHFHCCTRTMSIWLPDWHPSLHSTFHSQSFSSFLVLHNWALGLWLCSSQLEPLPWDCDFPTTVWSGALHVPELWFSSHGSGPNNPLLPPPPPKPRFNSQTPKPPDNSKTQQPDLKILVKGAAMTVEGSVQTTSSNNK